MFKEQIKKLSGEILPEVIGHRRYLHANPEISFKEYNTAAYVKTALDAMGIRWEAMATTGVVGIITGEKLSDSVIALRADMDALQITEENNLPFKSKNEGVMHACGHDVHTSSLLGSAKILQQLKAYFGGTIKLIFQPAEEMLPGGASQMIREGVLVNPKVQAVLGQHVMPDIPVGKIGFCSGKFMASSDEIYITVKGKGGHGAQPQQNIDPVVITAQIIIGLQQIVSRMANPKNPTVLSFGKLTANGTTNVIPDEVRMEGTFRTMDEAWRAEAHRRMRKIAEGIADSMGAGCDFKIVPGYPFLINEVNLTTAVRSFAEEYMGPDNVTDVDTWMAAEDFAYYSHATDACFYLLGVRSEEKGIVSAVHSSTFDVDENALEISAGLMAYLAIKQLGN